MSFYDPAPWAILMGEIHFCIDDAVWDKGTDLNFKFSVTVPLPEQE